MSSQSATVLGANGSAVSVAGPESNGSALGTIR